MIKSYATSVPILKRDAEVDIVSLERCITIDDVCHGREVTSSKSFYYQGHLVLVEDIPAREENTKVSPTKKGLRIDAGAK